jgi:hypothetical protein
MRENFRCTAVNNKVLKLYGKFERNTLKTGHAEENSALAIFCC